MKISCLALLLLFCQLVIFWLQIIDNLSRKSVNNRECSISPHKKSGHRKGLGLVELAAEGLRCFSLCPVASHLQQMGGFSSPGHREAAAAPGAMGRPDEAQQSGTVCPAT